jgi:hypothetical protein
MKRMNVRVSGIDDLVLAACGYDAGDGVVRSDGYPL